MVGDWLFLAVFGPLMAASLLLCGEDSQLRQWRAPQFPRDRTDARELWRFIRSAEPVPDRRLTDAARAWAEDVVRRHRCRWDRYSNWAWVLWITAGVVSALAFGTVRQVAGRLLFFDVMLLVAYGTRWMRRRAEALVASLPPRAST